jgi:hypothetical protein
MDTHFPCPYKSRVGVSDFSQALGGIIFGITKLISMRKSIKATLQVILLTTLTAVLHAQQGGKALTGTTTDSVSRHDTMQVRSLKAVTVVGAKPFLTMEADKIVMNVAESPVAAGNSVWNLLQRAPGVTEQNNELLYRGKNVTILINGRPSSLKGEDLNNMLNNMQAGQIEKIELIANPSARYDAEGGAVINIKLAKDKNFGTNGSFSAGLGAGRYTQYNSSLNLNNRHKKTNLSGSYNFQHSTTYQHNRSQRQLPVDKIDENEYERRTRNNHAYQLAFDYDINKQNTLGIQVKGYVNVRDSKIENTSVYDHAHAASDSFSKVFTNGYTRYSSPSLNVFYKTILDKKGQELTINGDYFSYQRIWRNDLATRFYEAPYSEYAAPYLLKSNSPSDINVAAASLDYVYPRKNGKWEMGLKTTLSKTDNDTRWLFQDSTTWSIDNGKTNHFLFKEQINAAYVSYSRLFKNKYSLQAGLRAEYTLTEGNSVSTKQENQNDYANLFPNISLAYMPSPATSWSMAYRKSINRFGFNYVNPAIIYQSQYAYSEGNPYLQPQINHYLELSHIYKYQLITAVGYMYSVKALAPVYHSSGNLLVSSYDNLGTYNMATLTTTLNKAIQKWWTTVTTLGGFYINVNLQGQSPGSSKNRGFSTYFSSNNTFRLPGKFTAELTALYRGAVASGIYKVNPYFNLNTGISKLLWEGKGTLAMNITDVFNTRQFTNQVENYQGVNGTFINKAESRFVNLLLTVRFGNNNVKAVKNRKTGLEEEKARTGAN